MTSACNKVGLCCSPLGHHLAIVSAGENLSNRVKPDQAHITPGFLLDFFAPHETLFSFGDSLVERKDNWRKEAEERQRNMPDPAMPPGHAKMPESQRLETLKQLKQSKEGGRGGTRWLLRTVPPWVSLTQRRHSH